MLSHKREGIELILLIGCSPSRLQMAQDSTDQNLAIDDSDLRSTDDIQNLTAELIPPARQSDESTSDEALDIVVTLCNGKMEMDSCSVAVRDSSDTTSQRQARMSDVFQSPQLAATIATPSLSESGGGLERPEQTAEVVDADQEWEIRDIIGKEDVDGVVHYLVEWNPTLVPKYTLKNAKEMVNKFEARLRAQGRQEKGRGRPPQSKVGQRTMLEGQAIKGTQQKKQRGRPRKQV
jgi:hypothetical protein